MESKKRLVEWDIKRNEYSEDIILRISDYLISQCNGERITAEYSEGVLKLKTPKEVYDTVKCMINKETNK